MEQNNDVRTLKTVEHTCEVIMGLKELEGAKVSELADYLDVSDAGAYNHLATLRAQGLVTKDGNKYKLSHRFLNLGEFVKQRNPIYDVGKEEIERLADETGESTHLMVEEFGRGIYLHKVTKDIGISNNYHTKLMETRDHLHWSSTGKSILAFLDEERVREIIDHHGLPQSTEYTITDEDRLFEELEIIREEGYAQQDQEQIRGTRAIGAPIRISDNVIGSISVSGPVSRIDDEKFHESIPQKVLESVNVIEVRLETQEDLTEYVSS
jgi:DNA-binding IclR family transcriptional regulator